MRERPYTILSCGVSIDGYLDAATPERPSNFHSLLNHLI